MPRGHIMIRMGPRNAYNIKDDEDCVFQQNGNRRDRRLDEAFSL
jgi:hypothetical protein